MLAKEPRHTIKMFLWDAINSFPSDITEMIYFLSWEIWKSRNACEFERRKWDTLQTIRRAEAQWIDNRNGMKRTRTRMRRKDLTKWKWPSAEDRN